MNVEFEWVLDLESVTVCQLVFVEDSQLVATDQGDSRDPDRLPPTTFLP